MEICSAYIQMVYGCLDIPAFCSICINVFVCGKPFLLCISEERYADIEILEYPLICMIVTRPFFFVDKI